MKQKRYTDVQIALRRAELGISSSGDPPVARDFKSVFGLLDGNLYGHPQGAPEAGDAKIGELVPAAEGSIAGSRLSPQNLRNQLWFRNA